MGQHGVLGRTVLPQKPSQGLSIWPAVGVDRFASKWGRVFSAKSLAFMAN